jgi:hypothetical protein
MASTPSWAVEHCTLVAENLMLAARTAGLATCWIGFAQTYNTRRKGRARAAADCRPIAPSAIRHRSRRRCRVRRRI